jgi:cytidylate kinase
MIVAIDGPAGAGKSTVSRHLAARLGFTRIDTGALYRGVALAARRAGYTPAAAAMLEPFVRALGLRFDGDALLLDGEDVSSEIRAPEISRAASDFAAQPPVRAGLMELQRRLGRSTDTIMDGRDIGTVVFPDADVKIYLTASAAARAERRHRELLAAGHHASFETVLAEIEARDHQDMNRAIAPLRQADDAVVVDATTLDLPGAVAACVALVEAARRRK